MNTQLPYAATAAVAAAAAFLVLGLTGLWWLAAIIGVLGLGVAAWLANRYWPVARTEAEPERVNA